MHFSIELLNPSHAEQVFNIYQHCRQDMEAAGSDQWNAYYPDRDTVADDMENRWLYGIVHHTVPVAVVTVNNEQDEAYARVAWRGDGTHCAVIHRLAVHPAHQQHGLARQLMDFAETHAATQGNTSIRLDAYSGNPRALRFYENRGYERRGTFFFPRRRLVFYAYEKSLI